MTGRKPRDGHRHDTTAPRVSPLSDAGTVCRSDAGVGDRVLCACAGVVRISGVGDRIPHGACASVTPLSGAGDLDVVL